MQTAPIVLKDRFTANLRFAAALTAWACLALGGIVLITAYTIRLDIAFLEANRMMKDEGLRNAIFIDVFRFDTWLLLAFPLGLVANAAIAAVFGASQERYFQRFRLVMAEYAATGERPKLQGLGPLHDTVADFLLLLEARLREDGGEGKAYEDMKDRVLASWPVSPRVYWSDQMKFGLLSGMLALYFSSLSMVVFWTANDNILRLSRALMQYANAEAPQFFATQLGMAEGLGWAVVAAITILSTLTGRRFADTTANAAYAVRRQLRAFLAGDTASRVFLRMGDPGRDTVAEVNRALDRIEARLKERAAGRKAA